MDRNTILGILIILAIFFLSEQFIWKKAKPTKLAKPVTTQSQTPDTTAAPAQTPEAPPLTLPLIPVKDAPAIRNDLVLQNDSLKVVFSNQGAVIKAVYLKKFKLANHDPVQLIPQGKSVTNILLNGNAGSLNLGSQPFQYEQITEGGQPGLRFFLQGDSAQVVEKRFVLDGSYGLKLKLKVHYPSALTGYSLNFDSGINHTEAYLKAKNQDYRFYAQIDNILQKMYLSKLLKGRTELIGKIDWAASRTKYFTIACLSKPPVLINRAVADTANGSPAFNLMAVRDKASIDWDESFILYFGPAQYDLLKARGSGLENIAERGSKWLRWLVDIFAWFLTLLYKLIPNYGVVIILFSLVLKVILHPLTHKSMDSSLKMQKIQPQVSAIQQQYKNDPKRLQQELSKLYKETGASPLGGCLPLLLQMPVFFALYTVLRYSLDMRQAGFFGWMKDLSEPDPYYVLPILMGVFMIVQQLMMQPKKEQLAQMDEKQQAMQQSQKMMTWVMPIVLFFVFKSMPAGLVLYWTVFNILSILQQYYLQKKLNQNQEATE